MGFAPLLFLPTRAITKSSSSDNKNICVFLCPNKTRQRRQRSIVPIARIFGPAGFEPSKLKVVFLGVDGVKHPGELPRTYTLTHSDFTSKLTLAISRTINREQLQGWYKRLQRDEVVGEWMKVEEKMSLHVHCHISGSHFLLDFIAKLRFHIFCKELPVVLKAFIYGDGNLFKKYPELEEAPVWVYFNSNLPEFNRVECWGPLKHAADGGGDWMENLLSSKKNLDGPRPCLARWTSHVGSVLLSLITWRRAFGEDDSRDNK